MKPAIPALFLAAGLTLFTPGAPVTASPQPEDTVHIQNQTDADLLYEVQRVYPWRELHGCLRPQQDEEITSQYKVRSVGVIIRKHDSNCHGAQLKLFNNFSFQPPKESFTVIGKAENPSSIRVVRGK